MISINGQQAASLYQATAKIGIEGGPAKQEGAGGLSFSDHMVKPAVESVSGAVREAEQMSASAVAGKADITQVVEAVTKAEVSLQTLIAVRDRVISAYEEIMRMPI